MIEVNLVEKKQTNASPYLFVGIFVFSALLIGLSFFLYQNFLEDKQESLMKVKAENNIHLNEIRQESQVIQQVNVIERDIEHLQSVIFPSSHVLQQTNSTLPEQSTIQHYTFTITDGLRVKLQGESIEETSQFVQSMRSFSFVEQAELVELEQTGDQYVAEFTFIINKDSLLEEAD